MPRPRRGPLPELDPRYPNCKAALLDGYGPYYKETHEEYEWYVDKDGDGVACDSGDTT
ncbi:excalibur calcium-binding domain-containing protein [Streptosporangium lutulentum]